MVLVFSYGSNSLTQLRGRVGNPKVVGRPARLHGWVRLFCLNSPGWQGAVASLEETKEEDHVTYGTVVELTDDELAILDKYEGGYEKANVQVHVGLGDEQDAPETAIAYLARMKHWQGMPSEQYLTAIRLMLSEMYPDNHPALKDLDAFGVIQGVEKPVLIHQHVHPPPHSLKLRSLLVLVNAKRTLPWTMPKATQEIEEQLAQVGVHSTAHLYAALHRGDLNKVLTQAGHEAFDTQTLEGMHELLGVSL
mmetsp:Transcript_4258/g.7451  ORF Transcript_4258/g.7451 Transcript_4258/m.7451 type:complete len:250 (-) Transcript_4258:153-902(-)